MTRRRIVHLVCTDAFAGVERYVLSLAIHQAQDGHDVTVIGGARDSMRPALQEAGADWRPGGALLPAHRSLRGVRTDSRPVTLITHMTAADALGGWWARHREATVVSVRHFAAPRGAHAVSRLLLRVPVRRIDRQIAVSGFVAGSIESAAEVVHSGVPSAPPTSDGQRESMVLVAQRLEPEKDTATAIRGWLLAGPPRGWRLVIAGDGSERASLEALAGAEPSVTFVGMSDDVPALMRRASLLVAPTRREGLGLSVLEAMAHGVAVIAADAGGHRETAGAVPGAALFAPGDAAALAALLTELIADAERRSRLGAALAELQRERFDRDDQCAAATAVMLGSDGRADA